ncbi:MAG: hypothetical protein JJU10_00040 [Idiomarina sp.]|nr:hypothetical protein [Idiomarina sp.]
MEMKSNVFALTLILCAAFCLATGMSSTATAATAERADTQKSFDEVVRDTQPPAGPVHRVRDGVFSPIQAVVYAAQAAPASIEGTFGFEVRNVGQARNGTIYFNSELNYREQMNVTVRMSQRAASYLQRTYGRDWVNEIVGRNIEVTGEAKRVPIYFFFQNGQRSDSYYYQTQIEISRPEQFKILPAQGE